MAKSLKCVLLFLFIAHSLFSQILIRGPYLQQPTAKSVVVRWRTDMPTNSQINFGVNLNSKRQFVVNSDLTTEHILKVENLEADTKYYYEVSGNNKFLGGDSNYYFQTVPTPDSKKAIYIWAGGDFGDISNEVYLNNQTQVRDSYLNYSKNFKTDLWLWLGDIGYGDNRDVQLQKSIFDFYGSQILTKIPFSAALGNHEFDEDPAGQMTRDVHLLKITSPPTNAEGGGIASNSKAFYSYNYGNTHFIVLDSYGMDDGKYRLYDTNSPQYQWFIKDLEANKSMWTIVFFHHPPYTKRAHDSDAEEELRLLRQTLVPVFDKYKVDLVLNGHSHIYERSYLIQNHIGSSETFDASIHVVNPNSGKYEKNEKPIINKTNGTVYVVAGTFGRLEPILATRLGLPAHPTSYYSNLITGGSLALKIEDNRLDCEWLCADGVVRDRFTMFKNVSKVTKINLEYGDKIKLKASWPGTYIWADGTKNKQEIEVSPLKDVAYSVKDSLGFLEDKFEIVVSPQPIIETQLTANQTICIGKTINGIINIKNTAFQKWKFTFLLSDEKGSFENPLLIKEVSSTTFNFTIPENLPEGNFYKIKVLPNSNLFEIKASDDFKISQPAEGHFINETQVPFVPEFTLKLQFTGSFPIDYKLNTQPFASVNQNEIAVNVKQNEAKTYVLEAVKNVCGEGKIGKNQVSIVGPLSIELEAKGISIYPNPVDDYLEVLLAKNQNIVVEIKDLMGKVLTKQVLAFGKNTIYLKNYPSGLYLIEMNTEGKQFRCKFLKQ